MQTLPNKNYCIVAVSFERSVDGDEMEQLQESFSSGKIKTDPALDVLAATKEQLCLELQEACDTCGLSGNFRIESVTPDVCLP